MPSRKYYDILGVSPGSSENEIRKKYRRLVMKYHPDKNPSPGAEKKFIEIKEAYEVLTGKAPEKQSTIRKQKPTANKEKEARVREAKVRYREQILKDYLENERYFRMLTTGPKWKTIRVMAVVGFIMASFLILDYILPRHYEPTKVTHYNLNAGVLGADRKGLSLIRTSDGKLYWISGLTYQLYGRAPNAYKETSWFFHNPINIVSIGKTRLKRYPVHFSFYSFGWLTAIGFLLPSVLFYYKKKTISFTVLYHFCYYGMGILMLLFLFTGDRWAHFLTLGFL